MNDEPKVIMYTIDSKFLIDILERNGLIKVDDGDPVLFPSFLQDFNLKSFIIAFDIAFISYKEGMIVKDYNGTEYHISHPNYKRITDCPMDTIYKGWKIINGEND
jgi:hypothetical protein